MNKILILSYLKMPEIGLSLLLDRDFNKVCDIEREIEFKWIKEKRCSCVSTLKAGRVLDCEHINKEIKEKTEEIRKRIKMKNAVSLYRELYKIQFGQNNSGFLSS